MSLDHILLGLLRDPATGYDLKRTFRERIRHFWSAELSQIYPTLKRLERRRMLRSRVEPSPRGPNRKVYSLTDAGRGELLRWLRAGPAVGTERFAYLAQLYFMDAIDDLRETRAFMTRLRDHLDRWLAQLESLERDVTAAHGDAPECYSDAGFHRFATLRMGIHSIASKVAWCDETLAAIDRRLAAPGGAKGAAGGEPREPEAMADHQGVAAGGELSERAVVTGGGRGERGGAAGKQLRGREGLADGERRERQTVAGPREAAGSGRATVARLREAAASGRVAVAGSDASAGERAAAGPPEAVAGERAAAGPREEPS